MQHIRAVHGLDAEAGRHGKFQREHPDALHHIIHRGRKVQLFITHADVIADDGFDLRLQRRHARFQGKFRFQKTERARDASRALTRRRRSESRRVHALQFIRAAHHELLFVIRAQRHQTRLAFHVERVWCFYFGRRGQGIERTLRFHSQPIVRRHAFQQLHDENHLSILFFRRPCADGFTFHAQQSLTGWNFHAR